MQPRPHQRLASAAAALAGALLVACASAPESGTQLYRWTDEDGFIRYAPDTDLVPLDRRRNVEPVAPVLPEGRSSRRAPGAPAVLVLAQADRPTAPTRTRAELERAIESDREFLRQRVSEGDTPPGNDPELRTIAERLPALQAELRALEAPAPTREPGLAP